MWQIRNPEWYDVVVAPNLVGDVISDNGSTTQGGMGLAAGGNIGDAHAMFEPIHGSAPKHAGKDNANPMAMILAAAEGLRWLGEGKKDAKLTGAGDAIEASVAAIIEKGSPLTYDMVGEKDAATYARVLDADRLGRALQPVAHRDRGPRCVRHHHRVGRFVVSLQPAINTSVTDAHSRSSGARVLVISTFDNSAIFVTYRTNASNPTSFTAYSQIDSAAVSASYQGLPMAFAVGNGVLLMSQPGFTSGQMRAYNGTSTSAVTTNDIAGRALVYHLNRFWTGGSVAEPTMLRYSEIGDHTNWNTTEKFIRVSKDDGEPIESIVIWEREGS